MPIESFYEKGLMLRGLKSEHVAITTPLLKKSAKGEEIIAKREAAGVYGKLVRQAFTELIANNIVEGTVIDKTKPASFENCTYAINPEQRKAIQAGVDAEAKKLKQRR